MNKKLFSLLAITTLLVTGCNGDKEEVIVKPKTETIDEEPVEIVHEHTFSKQYKYDEEYHWHPAICHPSEKKDYEKHSFGEEQANVYDQIYRQCIFCGYKKYIEDEGGGFSNVTNYSTPIDIHTDAQQEFLSYADNTYDKMSRNSYPDGIKNISNPVFNKISWKYTAHRNDLTYSISISQNEDMTNSFDIKGDNKQEIEVYNLYLDKNYFRINVTDPYGEVHRSKVYSLTVKDIFPRNLYVGSRMTNCRDTGGRIINTGGRIRQGLLYRTCGNGYNQDGKKIDDEGKDILINQLKVKTEINLHNNASYNFSLSNTQLYSTLMDYADGSPSKHVFSRNAESVKNVFEILAKEDLYPIYYHCRIGTDRASLIAILLNGVLGVQLNDIYQDHLFSNFGKIGSKRNIGDGTDEDIKLYIDDILKLPGESFNKKCYNALLTIGVPKTTISKILDIFIEGEKPNYEDNQIIVPAKDMTVTNGSVKYESKINLTERTYPSSYTVLNKNVKATATFNLAEAGDKEAYIYVGNNDCSNTKMINTSISAAIDGKSITIPTVSFKEAGMGYCNGNRINFYFVKLGDLGNILSGQHTIEITGVANDLILGNIAVLEY